MHGERRRFHSQWLKTSNRASLRKWWGPLWIHQLYVTLASHECHFHVGHSSEPALAASYSEAPCLSCASRGNRSKDPCSVNHCTQLQRVRCVQSCHECLSKVWVNAWHMWVHCTDAALDSLRKSQGRLSSQEAGPQTVHQDALATAHAPQTCAD